ncbi:MAG: glycosyltransferase family 1 protein [archaeon]
MERITVNYNIGLKRDYLCSIDKYNENIRKFLADKVAYHDNYFKSKQYGFMRLFKQFFLFPLRICALNKYRRINYFIDPASALNFIFPIRKKIIVIYDLNREKEGTIAQKLGYALTAMSWSFLKKADLIITISEATKKNIMEQLHIPTSKIRIVYPAVDHKAYRPIHFDKKKFLKKYDIKEDKKIILYVGTEQNRKNVDVLIRAMSTLRELGVKFQFVKIGAHQNEKNRKRNVKLIRELHLTEHIKIINQVEEKELPLFYNAADVFVFPSVFEGFGMPPLEAMACGCPVITTHKTSLQEVVGDAAIILKKVTPKSIADNILRVLQDTKLRKTLRIKGLRQAKKFDWKSSAENMCATLNAFERSYERRT